MPRWRVEHRRCSGVANRCLRVGHLWTHTTHLMTPARTQPAHAHCIMRSGPARGMYKDIRRWDSRNQLRCLRTPGGYRRVPISEIERVLSGCAPPPKRNQYGWPSMHGFHLTARGPQVALTGRSSQVLMRNLLSSSLMSVSALDMTR